jgi:bifunctional DNA-binding transcriptional regulator/antitoxin component of YhaV-PrlF toxin-antitoxin module
VVTSTLTDKGQTTVPQEIREAMGALPRQRLVWESRKDGSAVVRTMPNVMELAVSRGRAGGLGSEGLGGRRKGEFESTPDKTPMVGLFLNVECQDLTPLALP